MFFKYNSGPIVHAAVRSGLRQFGSGFKITVFCKISLKLQKLKTLTND